MAKEVTGYFTIKDRGLWGEEFPVPENDDRRGCRYIEVTLKLRTNGEWTNYVTGFGGLFREWDERKVNELSSTIASATVLLNDILGGTIQTNVGQFESNERFIAMLKKEREERAAQIAALEVQLAELRKAV